MAGRSRGIISRPPAPANGNFSDSDSSQESGSNDGRSPPRQDINPGLSGVRNARRRRSWAIPSLISRQGSRSNLGIDKGISRAHELMSGKSSRENTDHARLDSGSGRGSSKGTKESSLASSPPPAAPKRLNADGGTYAGGRATNGMLQSSSSSEEDMTWADFLAYTEGTGPKADSGGGAPVRTNIRRAPPPPPPVQRSFIPTSWGNRTKVARSKPEEVEAANGSTSHDREVDITSKGGGPKEEGDGAGGSEGSNSTSDSLEDSMDDSGVQQTMTWGQFVTRQKTAVPPVPHPATVIRATAEPPRKASADFDDFDDDEDDDIDDIMSTFGPVSLRPDQDDILFSHKEEEFLAMMDKQSEIGQSRGSGVDIVSVGRDLAKGRGGGSGGGHGRGRGVNRTAADGVNVGSRTGSGDKEVTDSRSNSRVTAAPSGPGQRKSSFPPPPSYSSIGRARESPPTIGVVKAQSGRIFNGRGFRPSEEGVQAGTAETLKPQSSAGQGTNQGLWRTGRPRAGSVDARPSEEGKASTGTTPSTSHRLGVPLSELRRAKEANQGRGVGVAQQGGNKAMIGRKAAQPSPPPYAVAAEASAKAGASKAPDKRSSDTGGRASPSLPSTAPQKLTASALQKLQKQSPGLPVYDARNRDGGPDHTKVAAIPSSSKVPGAIQWVQRSRNRDTLHSLIEDHAAIGSNLQGGEGAPGALTRERSNTEDSQSRAQRNLGGMEAHIDGSGEADAKYKGIGRNAAAALQSAMRLVCDDSTASRDTGPVTSSSKGSRFRTSSTISSSGPEMAAAIAAAASAEKRRNATDTPPNAQTKRDSPVGQAPLRMSSSRLRSNSKESEAAAAAERQKRSQRIADARARGKVRAQAEVKARSEVEDVAAVENGVKASVFKATQAQQGPSLDMYNNLVANAKHAADDKAVPAVAGTKRMDALSDGVVKIAVGSCKEIEEDAEGEKSKVQNLTRATPSVSLKSALEAKMLEVAQEEKHKAPQRDGDLTQRRGRSQTAAEAARVAALAAAAVGLAVKQAPGPMSSTVSLPNSEREENLNKLADGVQRSSAPGAIENSGLDVAAIGSSAPSETTSPKVSVDSALSAPPIVDGLSVIESPAQSAKEVTKLTKEVPSPPARLAPSTPVPEPPVQPSSAEEEPQSSSGPAPASVNDNVGLDIPYPFVAVEEPPTTPEHPPTPLTQQERDENVLCAHLSSWRFCFHEAAALLTPVLGVGCVDTPHGGREEGSGPLTVNTSSNGNSFSVAPSEEIDLQSEMWGKLVQAEALMLQTMLSVSSGANQDTMAACQAVSEALEISLPRSVSKDALRDEISVKLAAAAEVERERSVKGAPAASAEALETVSTPPTVAEQAILIGLEVLMVRVSMQLMAGHMMKAAATIRKVIKSSHWLLKAKDIDMRAAKKTRDRAALAASGASIISNLFFKVRPPAPAPAPPSNLNASRAGREGKRSGNRSPIPFQANGTRDSDGKASTERDSPAHSRSRFSSMTSTGGDMASEDVRKLIEDAVPTTFAGTSWEGYLHHVDFIVALMHVGTSLMPKNLNKILGHCLGYNPSFEKGLSLLSSCCRTKGMRRPCAAAVLELLVFRELKREAKMMKAHAPKAAGDRVRQRQQQGDQDSNAANDNYKRGFRRRIQFRQENASGSVEGGALAGEADARADALDNAQVALDSFYASFPVVPLLSVAHAKALQASGEFQEAYELCLMAQKVVDQSVEKGEGMGPAHDPHVLWLQLAHSSFFLQQWKRALEVFSRIVEGVTEVCEKDQRGLTGLSASYAAASMCGVQPVSQGEVHKLLVIASGRIKRQEAAGAKEHPVLRRRLQAHAARGPPGAELWLFEVLYLHNASAANSMPEAWHQSMLDLLETTPVAALSRAFPEAGVRYSSSETDAIMAHKFTEGLVLYKLERMADALERFRLIVESARDKDESTAQKMENGQPKVLLTDSRFVLPHALYLTAVLSYRLRPVGEQLGISHELCVRAKRIRDYDFDCQVKIGKLMATLRQYMDVMENSAR